MLVWVCVVMAAIMLGLAAVSSLRWRYEHDAPIMIYAGYLVAGGAVPYRDFFDMNTPGTYYVMAAAGSVFGWDESGFRYFDLFAMAALAALTYLWMRRFGMVAAMAAIVGFLLWYLKGNTVLSLQREYLLLLPFTGILGLVFAGNRLPLLRAAAAGACAGVAMLIKPHALLLVLPLLPVMFGTGAHTVVWPRRAVVFAAGLLLPLTTMCVYLALTGGLAPFVDMARNYWPLYTAMTGGHSPISGWPRIIYLVVSTGKGVATPYTALAILGVFVLHKNGTYRREVRWLCGLLCAAALYPAVAGQFWSYHWLPYYYLTLCCAAMSLTILPAVRRVSAMGAPLAVCVLLLYLSGAAVSHVLQGRDTDPPKDGVPDAIAQYLRGHARTGDVVQPLDWSGGAVHGMLLARASLATRFMYDFHFYHHVDSPYIHRLRSEFLRELSAVRPRFIVLILEHKPWPAGPGTTRDFPELQRILRSHYTPVIDDLRFRILERIDGDSSQSIQ